MPQRFPQEGAMVDRDDRDKVAGLTAEDPLFQMVLDLRIAEMHSLLDKMAPASPAVALQALRQHFPETPFDERVRALKQSRH
jgi:hypothetical protein